MKKIIFSVFVFLALLMSGCASKVESAKVPGTEFKEHGTFYVVHFDPDKRHLNEMIADQLRLMGFDAKAGNKSDMPDNIDTVVTYVDHWQWDITNYMIDITIQFREKEDEALIVQGKSYRTSLVRKTPEEMIKETLGEMLKTLK